MEILRLTLKGATQHNLVQSPLEMLLQKRGLPYTTIKSSKIEHLTTYLVSVESPEEIFSLLIDLQQLRIKIFPHVVVPHSREDVRQEYPNE
ncbi:MAG: hypothetical protein ABIK73_07015 [candidate division WOR-3 bacterium]